MTQSSVFIQVTSRVLRRLLREAILISLLFICIDSLPITGCGGNGSSITSVSLICTPTAILSTQSANCTASVAGTGAYSPNVTWSATDGSITAAGVFSPNTAGTAVITATSTQDTTKSASVQLPVSTINTITVTCAPIAILITQSAICTSAVTGAGAYSSNVTWSATGGSITAAGVFTPNTTGTAVITATSTQDSSKYASAQLSVATINAITVTCTPTAILSTQSSSCTATVTGAGAYSSNVTWSATGGSITTAGVFSPSTAGTSVITATSTQDTSKSASASIAVTQATALQIALPHLAAVMDHYDFAAQTPIVIASFGSSVGAGATLPDAATQAPCGHFVAKLRSLFPGSNGRNYNFVCVNESVNGSVSWQFPAAWKEFTEYALSGVSIANGGSGYSVGDWITVNQGNNANGGAIVVSAVDSDGSVTAIVPSAYPGCITDADTYDVTTNRYYTATNVPTTNGMPANCSVSEPTGNGSGLRVNIDTVGYGQPIVALFAYGMNDNSPLEYNTGETLQGGINALNDAVQTVVSAGADAVILTSPHSSVLWSGANQWTWNAQIGCSYSHLMSICDSSTFPNPSQVDVAGSVTTGDLAKTGTPIAVSSRMIVINQDYRELATQNKIPYIDAESYWFKALANQTAALGSQLAAEQELFMVAGPHPNLLGHQLSYQSAIDDFLTGLKPR